MIALTIGLVLCIIIIVRQNIIHKQEIWTIQQNHLTLLNEEKKNAIKKSKDITRGHISQEFLPLFPDFPYNMSDCKFSGQPIDFLVFKGMSDLRDGLESEIEIVFADVKVNTAQRSKIQNAIKKAVEQKRVRFETWKVDNNKKLIIK